MRLPLFSLIHKLKMKSLAHWFMQRLGFDASRVGRGGVLLLRKRPAFSESVITVVEDAHYWEYTKSLLESQNVDLVVDVGANAGQFASGLRAIGYRGRIASFEPIPELASSLKEQSKDDPEWIVYELALGSTCCEDTFEVPSMTVFASFREPSEYGRDQFPVGFGNKRRVPVRIDRLDNVFRRDSRLAMAKRVFVKLDTQGFDLEAFDGIGDIRNNIVLLQSELSLEPLYNDAPGFADSLAVYRSHGFSPCGFFPVCRDKRKGFLVEVDCLFLSDCKDQVDGSELLETSARLARG